MRRLVLTFLGFVVAVGVLVVSIFDQIVWRVPATFAQAGEENPALFFGASASATPIIEDTGDYYLAYPGILPDHPLYWLKMVRDRVRLWTVREPLSRARLLLLYADKRIGAAGFLAKGNKGGLATGTAVKAEEYLLQAVEVIEPLDRTSEEVSVFGKTMSLAVDQHARQLDLLTQILGEDSQGELGRAGELNRRCLEKLRAAGYVQADSKQPAEGDSEGADGAGEERL